MIKTHIRMRVTPKQSKQVQEICFANGIGWWNNCEKVEYAEMPYLIVRDKRLYYKDKMQFSEYSVYFEQEVSAELFIRTKGTCVEETPKQELKQN